ncbi:MAG: hypothetical protein V5A34_07110 [Halapricum sp.]|jgi:flagellar basal body-associated protein FliL
MEAAVIITVSVVLIILALTAVSRWLVPKALSEEDHDEEAGESQPPA